MKQTGFKQSVNTEALHTFLKKHSQNVRFVVTTSRLEKKSELGQLLQVQLGKYMKNVSECKEGRMMFYLMMHSTRVIYGYMALDIW